MASALEPPSEERELQLIEKLEFRIILHSNDDEKLQDTLNRYLRALLLKAESPHESVRSRTVGVAQRINGYIKPPGIVLPVRELLEQFKGSSSARLKTLDLMFVQHSIPRLSPAARRELAPDLIRGISQERYPLIAASLFNAFLRILPDLQIPPRGSPEEALFREKIGLGQPGDALFLATWLSKLVVLKPSAEAPVEGVSRDEYDFLTRNRGAEAWNIDSPIGLPLPQTRFLAINLLASAAFVDDEKFMAAVWASGSQDPRVVAVADTILKRSTVSLEDKDAVCQLFEAHSTGSRPVRIRILELLSKSAISCTSLFSDRTVAIIRQNIKNLTETNQQQDNTVTNGRDETDTPANREYLKLASATLSYSSWASRVGLYEEGRHPSVEILRLIFQFLEALGWPAPKTGTGVTPGLRSQIYETLGSLARTARLTEAERLIWTQRFFKSLAEDPISEVVVSIEGALSSISRQFSEMHALAATEDAHMTGSDTANNNIREFLRFYMNEDEARDVNGIVRDMGHAVTKFANDCMPPRDIEARWIDILAIAGRETQRRDVLEEGRRGLDLWTAAQRVGPDAAVPDWDSLVHYLFPSVEAPGQDHHGFSESVLNCNFLGSQYHGQRGDAVAVALKYCYHTLLASSLPEFTINRHWESELEVRIRNNQADREALREYTSIESRTPALRRLFDAAIEGAVRLEGKRQEQCLLTLVDLASISSTIPGPETALLLLPFVESNSDVLRTAAARAIGIIAPQPMAATETLESRCLYPLMKSVAVDVAVEPKENAEGALRALGCVLANRKYYGSPAVSTLKVARHLHGFVKDWDITKLRPPMKSAVIDMLSDLWTASIPVGLDADGGSPTVARGMLQKLLPDAKKKNERAIKALGRLCIAINEGISGMEDVAKDAMASLLGLTEMKEAEVHLAIGEALAVSAARWDSSSIALGLDLKAHMSPATVQLPSRVEYLLATLLEVRTATKPSVLRAYGIWLFSLVHHCHALEEIQERFRELQKVFMRLLSARDELVQETASRGLSLLFEKGNEDVRRNLVSDLTAIFTGDAKERMKVGEESEVFGSGDLETEDGKGITSYKDVVNLANEAGDPSLVYKLMSMSLHAATWSSRSAFGRFGLGSILSETSLPPSLYSKLYRYRFDPVYTVRRSMTDIWNAAVSNSGATINEHFTFILEELIQSLHAKEWRTREASCAATAELLSGRPFKSYQQYYQQIWSRAAKVLDDQKATVRMAALKLCMALSKSLVSELEMHSGGSAASKDMMEAAIPFLLSDKALGSGVQEVFAVAATTIIKVAEKGGRGINPFVPTMITELLGVMSTSEAEAVNYARNKYGGEIADELDRLRSAQSRKSPLWQAIENSLKNADRVVVEQLVPRLEEVIKTSLGVPTKLGCCHLIVTLVSNHAEDVRPHAAALLKLMQKQVFDNNNEVAKAYARSAGYLFKIAKIRSRELFLKHLVESYFSSESDGRRERVAAVVDALAKVASDQCNVMEALLLPLVFVGKNDPDETTGRGFREVWDSIAGSDRAVARVLSETMTLTERGLDTTQWALRHGAALATASAVQALLSSLLGGGGGQLPTQQAQIVWPALQKALALKTFEGKEKVLDAFVEFVAKTSDLWRSNPALAKEQQRIAIREAKRSNADYKVHALPALSRFAASRTDLDLMDDIVQLATPLLAEEREGNKGGDSTPKEIALARSAIEAITGSYNRVSLQDRPGDVLGRILGAVEPFIGSNDYQACREVWYTAVESLIGAAMGATKSSSPAAGSLLVRYAESLLIDVSDKAVVALHVRMSRAKAYASIAKMVAGQPIETAQRDRNVDVGKTLLEVERAEDIRGVLSQAVASLGGNK